ncbi:MAG: RHS repeat-associated core domain-containing protein, partial [Kiritimatiellae bacterium]|nr:RHS repeat-associated core domain-containing protein [Kiritimatiellia bacterium]
GTLQGAGGVGGLLAVRLNGTWHVPLYDANGNVTAYVSETGAVVAEYEYDAFGNTISQSGSLSDTFRHRFSTKPWIVALGVYDFGERLYSPELRRWLSRDPIEEDGGANLYAFLNNSPLLYLDPIGLDSFELRWVNKGPTYDGNNLWAAVWLWPTNIQGSGYVTSTLTIDEYTFKDCKGNRIPIAFHRGIGTYTVYDKTSFSSGINGTDGGDNGGIYAASIMTGGFKSGLYFSLIDTSVSRKGFNGKNLKCQKGIVEMTFSYSVHKGTLTSALRQNYISIRAEDIADTEKVRSDLFPFYPEAIHKKFDADVDESSIKGEAKHKLSISWDWCNSKDKKLEFTELPRGANRKGR